MPGGDELFRISTDVLDKASLKIQGWGNWGIVPNVIMTLFRSLGRQSRDATMKQYFKMKIQCGSYVGSMWVRCGIAMRNLMWNIK